MNIEILKQIGTAINALNNIEVKGETNLANLVGSIELLKNVMGYMTEKLSEESQQLDE